MKFACAVITAIQVLGSLWFISPAESLNTRLNLTERSATQSTTYYHQGIGLCNASNAIDCDYNTNHFIAPSCATTNGDSGISWWRVDFDQPVKVRRVMIVNRSDCCEYRLDYFVAGLSNSSTVPVRGYYALCGQYPGPAPSGANLSLQCHPHTASGRYLIVQQKIGGDGYLTICEIEIYAGQVRKLDRWERLSNKRLISTDVIVLSKRSPLMCVGKCQQTVGCDSANYRQVDKRCEMNFVPAGATGSHIIIEDGWDNWVQMYEFI